MRKRIKSERMLRRGDVDVHRMRFAPWPYRTTDTRSMSIGGDAPKVFIELLSSRHREHSYIAKAPKTSANGRPIHGAKECVTEALISSIGRMLPLRLADFELYRIDSGRTPDVRFMSRYFLGPLDTLYHGDELVALWLGADEREIRETFAANKKDERSFYTIDLLVEILQEICLPSEFVAVRDGLGRMLGFDAVIGANDRHPRNWGVIASGVDVNAPLRFAPVFDTARGLFWNHSDPGLEKKIRDQGRAGWIRSYANKSNPLISCQHHDDCANVNHFDLVSYIIQHPELGLTQSISSVIRAYSSDAVATCLQREYSSLLSGFRLALIIDLLDHRHQTLMKLLNERGLNR